MSYRQSNVVTGHHGVTLVADLYPQPSTEKPSVILLHGGGQNRHAWTKTARTIHAAGHHDHIGQGERGCDLRGHGDSSWDPAGRYDTEDLAYDLLAVRERYCGRRPAVAVGASIGGMTTLIAHRIAPPRLWAGVVLVDVTPRMEIDGARRVVQFMSAHPDGFATLHDAIMVIGVFVVVEYGVRIPHVAWQIQTEVRQAVEQMTGKAVKAVQVSIEGVRIPPHAAAKAAMQDDEVQGA